MTNIPPVITIKQAKAQNMEPLTIGMTADDPNLRLICKDMDKIKNTQWALVHEGMKRISVWRVPKAPMMNG